MKFATKLSILFTVFFLAAGCVSQRGVGTGGGTSSQDNDNSNATGISGNAEDREGQMMLESSEAIRAPKQKVGLLIAAKDYPTHTHYGTTKFNNFTKEYPYDWQLSKTLFSSFEQAIEKNSRFSVVDISSRAKDPNSLDFVKRESGSWRVNRELMPLRKALLKDNITYVIVVKEAPTVAIKECGTYGCSDHVSEGFGLFTRSFLGTDHYIASASFDVSIERLDEPEELLALPELSKYQDDTVKNTRLEAFTAPENFDELTEQELAPIKSAIVNYFDDLAKETAKHFSTK